MAPDRTIDLTSQVCPMTFVRTRLALDGLEVGQRLLVLLRGAESVRRVPMTVGELGHLVVEQVTQADGTLQLLVEKR